MTAETALAVSSLQVSYGGVLAVRDVSFEVAGGEIVGLIGPNGAGKSTTLHAIVGLVRAQDGDVLLGGRSLRGRSPEAIARAGVALVPEGRRLFAELTVEDNLRLGLAAHGLGQTHDGLTAELERLLHDRRMDRAVSDAGEGLVGFVERDDAHLSLLPGFTDGVQDGRTVVAPQPDQALDVRVAHQRVGRVRLCPHCVSIVGAHVDDGDVADDV